MRSSGSAATTAAFIDAHAVTSCGERGEVTLDHRVRVVTHDGGDGLATRHQRVLGDLTETGPVLPGRQRRERRDVGEHRDRLVERADEVLPLRKVHRGLAADRGVDLREQRGGCLHHVDAAVVDGRDEARGVTDHTAAERNDRIAAEQSPSCELRAELVDGGERLGVFAVADQEHVGLGAGGVERSGERRARASRRHRAG